MYMTLIRDIIGVHRINITLIGEMTYVFKKKKI